MKIGRSWMARFVVALLALSVVIYFGCAEKPRKKAAALDTPEHHVFSGNNLLDKGRYEDAKREFQLALELNPKYSPAFVGMGLAFAFQNDFEKAFKNVKKGLSTAKDKDQKVNAHVGMIRLYAMQRKGDWLDNAVDQFDDVMQLNPKSPEAHYFMGIAYKRAFDFDKAGEMFKKVLDFNDKYITEANKEWKIVQKIQRAAPGTRIGKQIALIDEITRADIAALFIQELKLEKLYQKRTPKRFDTSFKSPTKKYKADWIAKAEAATDIQDHVLRTDIEIVLSLMVKGLEPSPDHRFFPNKKIVKAEYAMMIEDILIKVSGDKSLATKFIGSQSPFPDLRSDLPFFNAVMVCTSRGIMEARDMTTGEFGPMDPVSGADALLIIRRVKEELKFF